MGKILAYVGAAIMVVVAGILILFSLLFILGSGSAQGQSSWFGTGLVLAFFGLALLAGGIVVFFLGRKAAAAEKGTQVTYQIDLPSNVKMDTLKCQSCGGVLAPKDVQMVAGAPMVSCPYCHTTYQLKEDPKW
ncbi:MAG TPA: hypothetical protein PKW33_17375 [Anaerolineaceae bacterium]|nr:hypothetical protein [Anaerolineaceae bacterium]HPN53372.1 hypothetical protein [Anaerolineaceae bacterium]